MADCVCLEQCAVEKTVLGFVHTRRQARQRGMAASPSGPGLLVKDQRGSLLLFTLTSQPLSEQARTQAHAEPLWRSLLTNDTKTQTTPLSRFQLFFFFKYRCLVYWSTGVKSDFVIHV